MMGRSLLLAALWAAGASAAHACDWPTRPPTEMVKNAAMVFVGRVPPGGQPAQFGFGAVSFVVEEAFQGVARGETVMADSGGGDCANIFQAGEAYLVFLSPTSAGVLPDASKGSGTEEVPKVPAVLRWLRNRNLPAWKTQLLGVVWSVDNGWPGDPLKPLPGAKIIVSGNGRTATATSDREGIYQFSGLPPGEYEISGSVPGRDVTPYRRRVGACCVFANIGAVVDGHVGGLVRNAAGAPVDGVRVELISVWPHGEIVPFKAIETTRGGGFLFRGVPPGQYRIGVKYTTFRSISVSAQQDMTDLELVLPSP